MLLSWASARATQRLGAASTQRVILSHLWQLMLAVGWELSWGRQPRHSQGALPRAWASSQHGGWVQG